MTHFDPNVLPNSTPIPNVTGAITDLGLEA